MNYIIVLQSEFDGLTDDKKLLFLNSIEEHKIGDCRRNNDGTKFIASCDGDICICSACGLSMNIIGNEEALNTELNNEEWN